MGKSFACIKIFLFCEEVTTPVTHIPCMSRATRLLQMTQVTWKGTDCSFALKGAGRSDQASWCKRRFWYTSEMFVLLNQKTPLYKEFDQKPDAVGMFPLTLFPSVWPLGNHCMKDRWKKIKHRSICESVRSTIQVIKLKREKTCSLSYWETHSVHKINQFPPNSYYVL